MSWPQFSFPFGAWFFLALIPLIVLYFLKLKRPRHDISSLVLWQSVINDQRVNSPFQKFRRNLLLLLQLILLCLLVLALMQPFLSGGAADAQYVPILIDCSASMGATSESSDETRLEAVQKQALELIDRMRSDQRFAVFSFAESGRRLTDFTDDPRILKKAIEGISVTHLPGKLDDVLRMTAAYSKTYPIAKALVLTDGNLNDTVDVELPFELEIRNVDPGGPNLGITELNARRSGPEEWDVFVRVGGSTVELRTAQLQLYRNGELVATESTEVAMDESERFVFPITSAKPELLEARIIPNERDSLEVDNSVWLSLPEARPLKVWTSPELYSWRHALNVLPRLDVAGGTETQPELPEYDLLIANTTELGETVAPVRIFIGVVPPDATDLVAIRDASESDTVPEVVDWNRTSPLLRHVQLTEVQLGQEAVFADGASVSDLEERGYEVLIDGNRGPLLLQKREGLNTTYYFLFHTDRSTLPYRIAFPILVSNSAETALRQASLSEVTAAATGVLPPLNVEPDREYTLRSPDGSTVSMRSSANGLLSGAAAGTVGRYDIMDGQEIAASVGTGLLSPLESSLTAFEELQFSEVVVETSQSDLLDTDRSMWWVLAFGAFLFLLIEWWYFQRVRGAAA